MGRGDLNKPQVIHKKSKADGQQNNPDVFYILDLLSFVFLIQSIGKNPLGKSSSHYSWQRCKLAQLLKDNLTSEIIF